MRNFKHHDNFSLGSCLFLFVRVRVSDAGIGHVYKMAKQLGFMTTGIVSRPHCVFVKLFDLRLEIISLKTRAK